MLVLAVFVSALGLVRVRHESRQSFIQLQSQKTREAELQNEWGRLQLEYSTWSDPARIERIARQQLGMRPPRPDEVHWLPFREP